ncbi:hypothetical protein BGW80DRAFT_508444 [Lactifluus volemus]|nr:hypothetical protein BGW80DRAFT_508444 [Lactifluus volemus]
MVIAHSPFCTQKGGVIDQADSGLCGLASCSSLIDGALVALGNILFLGDLRVSLITGPQKTFYLLARRNKLRGTVCFLGGILFAFFFFKWPATGVFVEMFGFLNLFVYDTSVLYVTAPHNFLEKSRACHTTATPSSFWASRFTCHRCMASTLAYAVSHFPARL